MAWSEATAEAWFACRRAFNNEGTAIEASTPTMATAINTSISVKPVAERAGAIR
jgi:hypothetical protein